MTKQPLTGMVALNTRATGQAAELTRLLHLEGAEVLEIPLFNRRNGVDLHRLVPVLMRLEATSWVVVTSANAVRAIEILAERDPMLATSVGASSPAEMAAGFERLKRARIAAVGPQSARALRAVGLPVELVPTRASGAELARTLLTAGIATGGSAKGGGETKIPGRAEVPAIVVFRGEPSSPGLLEGLANVESGMEVLTLYQMVPRSLTDGELAELRRVTAEGSPVIPLLFSGEVVEAFAHLLDECGISVETFPVICVIGPEGAARAATLGFPRVISPVRPAAGAAVERICDWARSGYV